MTLAKFKFESLERERDSVLTEKRRLSSSLGEEVSKTIEEEERIHRDRLASLEKERLEAQSTLGELQSRLEELSLHLQSLRSQAELALSGLNESHILSEQKNSECLMKELSSLRVLVFTICDNRKRSADFRDPRTPTRPCLASLWMRRFCSFGRVDSDAMS